MQAGSCLTLCERWSWRCLLPTGSSSTGTCTLRSRPDVYGHQNCAIAAKDVAFGRVWAVAELIPREPLPAARRIRARQIDQYASCTSDSRHYVASSYQLPQLFQWKVMTTGSSCLKQHDEIDSKHQCEDMAAHANSRTLRGRRIIRRERPWLIIVRPSS